MILALSCVLCAAWVRSLEFEDWFSFPNGDSIHVFEFMDGSIGWSRVYPAQSNSQWSYEHAKNHRREREQNRAQGLVQVFERDFLQWRWKAFGFSAHEWITPPSKGKKWLNHGHVWTVHYWSIVIPLTLLSAWLLLSTTRAKKEEPASQLQHE